ITSLTCLSSATAKGPAPSANSRANLGLREHAGLEMQRFQQGMRFGAFTNAEATRIKSHIEDFHTQVQNARAANNGRLTESQRDRAETALKRANTKFSQLAHNEDQTVPRQISTQAQNQKEEIRRGIQSAKLTQEEASRIKTLEQKIHTNLQQAKSDGKLTKI